MTYAQAQQALSELRGVFGMVNRSLPSLPKTDSYLELAYYARDVDRAWYVCLVQAYRIPAVDKASVLAQQNQPTDYQPRPR